MTVIEEIAAERKRQIEVEGWTHAHDDQHVDRSLARAAATYTVLSTYTDAAREDALVDAMRNSGSTLFKLWPHSWAKEWWKPKTRRSDLIRAAALIVAEIERLDRA